MSTLVLLISLLGTLSFGQSATVDRTLEDRAVGAYIVQTVVDKIRENCIYPNDRLFLRRLAYVESHDGMDTDTFRQGFYGGIWQVPKVTFDSLKNCVGVEFACDAIEESLHIRWGNVRWEDLTKPLYSGLAASLYLLKNAGNSTPGKIDAQANFWVSNYRSDRSPSYFKTEVNKIEEVLCNAIDLAFILDGSGSIGYLNFLHILDFVKSMVDQLTIGPNDVHVAVVPFSDYATIDIGLNSYYSSSLLKNAIDSVTYAGGGTNTADGIRTTREAVFNGLHGSREGVTKAAIVVTDGASNDFNDTVTQARLARDDGIVMFAIGIGFVNRHELESIADSPNCTHVSVLSNFSDIDSILYEIKKGACRAPVKFSHGSVNDSITVTNNITTPITIDLTPPSVDNKGNETENTTSAPVTVKTTVNCGIVHVYASYNNPHPGPALYDIKDTALDGNPSILYVNRTKDGRPLYVAYIGSELPKSEADLKKCNGSIYTVEILKGSTEVICRENGVERQCTKTDIVGSPYGKWVQCSSPSGTFTPQTVANPCTPTALHNNEMYHPYPYDDTWFIKCDLTGKMYITLCPNSERYHQGSHSCGSTSPSTGGSGNKIPLDPDLVNPCTAQAILNHHLFFDYTKDNTKFIHCDVWGHAWILKCAANLVWSQAGQTCIENTHSNGNPCTQEKLNQGITMFPHPDPHKYIHCDNGLNPWVQSCILGLVFDYSSQNCVYPTGK